MSSLLFMLITYYSVVTDTCQSLQIIISITDMIRSVTPLWYHFIPSFADHYNIIFYSYWWCHTSLSQTIHILQSSVITYHSDLILCYYCIICSLSFIMGTFLGLFHPLLIVSSTCTKNTLDIQAGSLWPKILSSQHLQSSDSSLNLLARLTGSFLHLKDTCYSPS